MGTGRENAYQPSQVSIPLADVYQDATGTVKYDYLTRRAAEVQGGDVGEIAVPRREISGRVWRDDDYDGEQAYTEVEEEVLDAHGDPVLDENGEPLKRTVKRYDEPGIEGESVTLTQWNTRIRRRLEAQRAVRPRCHERLGCHRHRRLGCRRAP